MNNGDITTLTDEELIFRTENLAADLRHKTFELIEYLMEMDRRRLLGKLHFVSLFDYCVRKLRMSEGAAYRRIRAARAIKIYPPAGELLRDGKITLETLVLLHPFLNDSDAGKLIQEAMGLSTRDVEKLVAGRRIEPARRDVVRFISTAAPRMDETKKELEAPLFIPPIIIPASISVPALVPAPVPAPIPALVLVPAPAQPLDAPAPPEKLQSVVARPGVRISFTADEEFFKLLRQAQGLMRHTYPDGCLDGIFRDALKSLLNRKFPWAFPRPKRKSKSCALSPTGGPTVGANS